VAEYVIMERIFLDYNATTPLGEAARDVLRRCLIEDGAARNASSMHAEGRVARAWMDEARWRVARRLGVEEGEIVFTSGGTEAAHLAIVGGGGARLKALGKGGRILYSAIEHHCVMGACEWLRDWAGCELSVVRVDARGVVDLDAVKAAVEEKNNGGSEVLLVSVMAVNNEVGTRQPVEAIGRWCRERGILFHVDAVQLAGKESLREVCACADWVSFSGHKIYGPHGVGVLFSRAGLRVEALLRGGGQEMGRRAGTEYAAGALALAAALEACEEGMASQRERLRGLVERLWKGIESLGDVRRNGDREAGVGNTLSVTFAGLDQQALLMALDLEGVSVSSGSACVVGTWQPSHVLAAMGLGVEGATVRFSLGAGNTADAIDEAVRRVTHVVTRLRKVGVFTDG
jgi:cysteine desulfurase